MEDARPAHSRPLAEVQDDIEHILQIQRGKLLQQQWIDRLKAGSHVQYF